jgi:hypothetical protein
MALAARICAAVIIGVPRRPLLIEINQQFRIMSNDVKIPINDISDIYIEARIGRRVRCDIDAR